MATCRKSRDWQMLRNFSAVTVTSFLLRTSSLEALTSQLLKQCSTLASQRSRSATCIELGARLEPAPMAKLWPSATMRSVKRSRNSSVNLARSCCHMPSLRSWSRLLTITSVMFLTPLFVRFSSSNCKTKKSSRLIKRPSVQKTWSSTKMKLWVAPRLNGTRTTKRRKTCRKNQRRTSRMSATSLTNLSTLWVRRWKSVSANLKRRRKTK